MPSLSNGFDKLAHWTARHAGRPTTFALALAIIVVWGVTGPIFQWSDTWQLIINTGTTIVTFLMVFLIQDTQNRDTEALQLMWIGVEEGAREGVIGGIESGPHRQKGPRVFP